MSSLNTETNTYKNKGGRLAFLAQNSFHLLNGNTVNAWFSRLVKMVLCQVAYPSTFPRSMEETVQKRDNKLLILQ